MINYIAGVLVVLFALAVILNQIKLFKQGQSGCGGGCSGCSARTTCNQKGPPKEDGRFDQQA